MGFFSDDELGLIRIVRMNFQIVGEETFTARNAMTAVEFEDFFLNRIREMDASSIFNFREGSRTKVIIERMASGQLQFHRGAVQLASDFDSRHVGQSSSGAFFTFELATGDPLVKLYAMLKYDYREVLAPARVGSARQLRKIVEAFVQDRRALQKSCLVRVRGGIAEDELSAKDRNGHLPDITDFFTAFLDVHRNRDDIELNRQVSSAVTEVLKAHKELLPNQDVSEAIGIARERLRTASSINDGIVLDAILVAAGRPQSEEIREMLEGAIIRAMKRKRVSGLEITPDQNVLKRSVRRKIITREGIRLDYPQSLEGVRVNTLHQPNGSATITIQTDHVDSDTYFNETTSSLRK